MWWLQKGKETVLGMPGPRRWKAHCRQCSGTWREHAETVAEVDICWCCGGQDLTVTEDKETTRDEHRT